jgi:Skp family chaperone for outer membrane proteins
MSNHTMYKKYFHKLAKALFMTATLILFIAFSNVPQTQALAIPPTPNVVAKELDKADDPKVAVEKIKQLSQDHKQELAEGPKPIQENAKAIAKNIQTTSELASKKLHIPTKGD